MTQYLRSVILGLILAVLLALIGIVLLVALDKSVPDVLGYVVTTSVAGLLGILVPGQITSSQPGTRRRE